MALCYASNLEVPDLFPLAEWEAQRKVVFGSISGDDPSFMEYGTASVCIVHRFRACHEAVRSMIEAWRNRGEGATSAQHLDQLNAAWHYHQQRDLFAFFSSGLSVIESALYGCFVFAGWKTPGTPGTPGVPSWTHWSSMRDSTDPAKLRVMLARAYPPDHSVLCLLSELATDPAFKDWKSFRNTLTHRGLPARLFERGPGERPELMLNYARSLYSPELRVDEAGMECKLDWLAGWLRRVLVEGSTL